MQPRPPMDRSSKAVISQVLAGGVTPFLKLHGFDRRGRTYDRVRDERRELITVEPQHCNRYGGSFRISLGVFLPEVDSVLSLYPLQEPPQDYQCHIRRGLDDIEPGWWEFDAATDRSALGIAVRRQVEHNALEFFDNLSTRAGILAWVRRSRTPARTVGLHGVVLAAYAGEPALAQEWLDMVVAEPSPTPNRVRREAARIAARLGLTSPAPTDAPALTAVFRVAADMTPQDRHTAFHHLDYKFRQYVELFRTVLPVEDPAQLYHTAECTTDACTITFYGADPDELPDRLRRAFDRLSDQFADITWHITPR